MSHQRDIERGSQAAQVIESEIYAEAYAAIEQEIHKQWAESRNPQEREELHRFLLAHQKTKKWLEAVMRNGQAAAKMLEQEQSRADRMTGYLSRRG